MEVAVYTWPYQWLYEPVYWALSELQESGSWRFVFKPSASDESVLNEFINAENSLCIALSAPPVGIKKYRWIPVLWRLPCWGFQQGVEAGIQPDSELSTDCSHEILLHPDKNTRRLVKHLRQDYRLILFPKGSTVWRSTVTFLQSVIQRNQLELDKLEKAIENAGKFEDFISDNTNATQQGIVFTYSPLHVLDRSGCTSLCKVPGGAGIETTVVFHDNPESSNHRDVERLRNELLQQVNRNIRRLYDTIDPYHDLLPLLRAYDERLKRQKIVGDRGDSCQLERDNWCRSAESRAKLLAVYLHHGCYFPLGIIPAALAADLWSMVKLMIQRVTLEDVFVNDLAQHCAWEQQWFSLSTLQRYQVLSSKPLMPNINGQSTLAGHLTHLKENTAATEFNQVVVDLNGIPVPLRTFSIREESSEFNIVDLACPARNGESQTESCGNPKAKRAAPCRICMMLHGHFLMQFLAERYLSRIAQGNVEVQRGGDVRVRFRSSPFAPEDVQKVLDVFMKQEHQYPNRENEAEKITIDFRTDQNGVQDATSCVLLLLSTTKSRPGMSGGNGTTTHALEEIVNATRDHGLELWKGAKSGNSFSWSKVGENGGSEDPVEQFEFWNAVMEKAEFAIVARLSLINKGKVCA